MNLKKLMSLMLAFVMMLAVVAPTAQVFATTVTEQAKDSVTGTLSKDQLQKDKPDSTKVNIYKLTTKEGYSKNAPWKHNGGLIKTEDYNKLGKDVKGLAGVKFTVYKINAGNDVENEKILNTLKDNPSKFETVEQMQQLISNGSTDPQIAKGKLAKATGDGLTDGQTGETAKNTGLTTIKLADGYYWFVESAKPDKVVDKIAVPFGLTLPLVNSEDVEGIKAGTQYLKEVNIYPKNIETEKPKVDKNIAKYDDKIKEWKDPKTGETVANDKLGTDYQKYLEEKAKISAQLGAKVPYEVKTELPRNYKFETISWSDIMSEGLTYNKDLEVTVTYFEGTVKKENQAFDISKFDKKDQNNGFTLTIKKGNDTTNLEKWLKDGKVEFTLKYSATVNNNTVVDKPQTNSITFKPGEPNPGGEVTPGDNGEITVTKTWANKDNSTEPKDGSSVTYYLIDESGKTVASVTLNNQNTTNQEIVAGKGIKFIVGDKWYKGKFTGLEKNKKYTIKEAVDGYEPTFDKTNDATANITNKEDSTVIKPKEPKVEFHGKKFVKLDQLSDTTRLAGAEFVVRRAKTKTEYEYLVVKSSDKKIQEETTVSQKKTALDEAIKKFNALSEEAKKQQTEKDKVDTAQKNYNDAVIAARTKFEWGNKDDAYVLVSDAQGRFEITGLSAGKYELEEITAPDGYALNDKGIEFEVKNGTYQGNNETQNIQYTENKPEEGYGFKVPNKKYTIPQTGGIGTVIFTVVGAALMGGAIYMMKRNKEEAN